MNNLEFNKKIEKLNYQSEIEAMTDKFKCFFQIRNYNEINEVPITSDIDPTVRFIGSHISVFKPYLTNFCIPNPGIFMKQDCIRTHNSKYLFDTDKPLTWGSYFPSIGVLSPYKKIDELIDQTFKLITEVFKINFSDIHINISTTDTDLNQAIKKNKFRTKSDYF
jgi:alanyl-tRNA synthetase